MGTEQDTSIKVSKDTRSRLGELAAEQGTTIRDLVAGLAASVPTRAELAARAEQARIELRERFGVEVTAEDEAVGHRLWDRITGAHGPEGSANPA
ncbi:hypothetical protein [Yinghuangia sp. YIM S10712]|uniref:hypothetical protein n=1 Tax=Yinghuangia sp. YIM S10712 TaxID=3436930 RepID=UPI003F52B639